MQIINVKIKRIEISSFTPSTRKVSLDIIYDSGKLKKIRKENIIIYNPEEIAHSVIKEIRRKEKKDNYEFNGEKLFDNYINVIMENEDATQQKIESFLLKLQEKIDDIANTKTADNYLNKINQIRLMKSELYSL
jgi:hypothetical protein